MTLEFEADLSDFTDKALIIMVLKGQQKMNVDIANLQTQFAALQAANGQLAALTQTAVDLGTKAIAALEDLSKQLTDMAAVQPAINDLATQAAATVASLQSEAVQLTTQNAATQAELDKINPPTP